VFGPNKLKTSQTVNLSHHSDSADAADDHDCSKVLAAEITSVRHFRKQKCFWNTIGL